MISLRSTLKNLLVSDELEATLNKIEKPVGSMGYDPWGFNVETSKIGFALMKNIYEHYFRVETTGIDEVPAEGPVLIIGNHSGQIPIDGVLVAYAISTRENNPRIPRAMIERFFPKMPFIGNLLNKVGGVLGDPVNCSKLLSRGEAIIVFPEGVRGSGKLFKDRYQLKRFGNGFIHLAMKHQAPVVPVGIIGCEETMPAVGNIAPLANILGVPYVPVTLPLILPAHVRLHFGKPIYFSDKKMTDTEVSTRVDLVKEKIQALVEDGLKARDSVFL